MTQQWIPAGLPGLSWSRGGTSAGTGSHCQLCPPCHHCHHLPQQPCPQGWQLSRAGLSSWLNQQPGGPSPAAAPALPLKPGMAQGWAAAHLEQGVGSCTSGMGGGQLHIWLRLHSTITSTSTSTFPPPVLLPLPSCSRRLEPTGHQCWVQSVSFTHTALSCSATPLSERWRGKGKKQNQKGCKHTLCSAGSSQQGLQVLLARRANFDSEDQTDPAFPYSLPHSGHSFGPWSLCTPHI